MNRPEKGWLAEPYDSLLTTQQYSASPPIHDVAFAELRRFVEDGGEFQELGRLDEQGIHQAFPGFKVRQVNYSVMEPGVIKAFHLHRHQQDVWFVPPQSKLVVGLLDCRADSPTRGVSMRVVMGDGRSRLLRIPCGVAHGAANLTDRPGVIVYLVDRHFDAKDPDEHRLPYDVLGPDFWRILPG